MITRWRVLGFIGGGGYGIPPNPMPRAQFENAGRRSLGHRPIRVFGTHTVKALQQPSTLPIRRAPPPPLGPTGHPLEQLFRARQILL
jgi:hypothetical protein